MSLNESRGNSLNPRIDYLDGLRGVAVLLILGYHAFSRWPENVPYGNQYSDVPIFERGWLGVQLFFLVSGFVILMTLEKCKKAKKFLCRRWLRLFPAMLIASLLIYFTSGFLNNRPAGEPTLANLLPGLTFVEPYWWNSLLNSDVQSLEGAFWTLYVEVKFYVFAAAVYYALGRNVLICALAAAYLCSLLLGFADSQTDIQAINFLFRMSHVLSLEHFGWFAAGAAYYIFHQSKHCLWFYLGLFISVVSSLFISGPTQNPVVGALVMSMLFALAMVSQKIQAILKLRCLLFLGFISYPLYLIHENAMISMISQLGRFSRDVPGYLYPVLPVMLLTTVAFLIAKYGEKYLKMLMISPFK